MNAMHNPAGGIATILMPGIALIAGRQRAEAGAPAQGLRAGTALVLLLAVLAFWWWQGGQAEAPAQAAASTVLQEEQHRGDDD